MMTREGPSLPSAFAGARYGSKVVCLAKAGVRAWSDLVSRLDMPRDADST